MQTHDRSQERNSRSSSSENERAGREEEIGLSFAPTSTRSETSSPGNNALQRAVNSSVSSIQLVQLATVLNSSPKVNALSALQRSLNLKQTSAPGTVSKHSASSDAPIQMVKRYNHSRKLYVNDEDNEPAPFGYTTVSKYFQDTSGSEWTSEREPSRYYVGSGDLSGPLGFYQNEWDQNRHPSMTVTTYDSLNQASSKYPNYQGNRWELEQRGASVEASVDATDPGTMSDTEYDEVHFENPHTGVYGSSSSAEQNQKAVESNQNLMVGSMIGLKKKMRPSGMLRITEGGFPYRSSSGRTGMNLDQIAKASGYDVMPGENIGTQSVSRTIGGTVNLPNSTRHNYRKQDEDISEHAIATLVSPSTDWVTKYYMVRQNPMFIEVLQRLGFNEVAAVLKQYLEMEELNPSFVSGNNSQDRNEDYDREPPPMGGTILRSDLEMMDVK